jgi:pimeloyl-ACP methyl ester carboxylesterase
MWFVLFAAVFIAVGYGAICVLLYADQDNLIFYRVVNDPRLAQSKSANRISIEVDGATLEGWWTENPAATNNRTLIYFGGNGEDILYTADAASRINARRMLVTNYRGYGESTGKPSEQALFADALEIYDYVAMQPNTTAQDVIVMGRSLGSGVAVHLAKHRSVRSVVLVTPYDSMTAVAKENYPYLPVDALLKHRFSSIDLAPSMKTPALILAAQDDDVIPPAHAQKLFAAWAGPKSIHILENVGHNDIEKNEQYYRLLNQFITE